jgi:hypothetical protein
MTTYNEYKTVKQNQDSIVTELSAKLNSFAKYDNGAIIDEVRNSIEFKTVKMQFDIEFSKLQNINIYGNKNYKKQLDAERKAKRALRYA